MKIFIIIYIILLLVQNSVFSQISESISRQDDRVFGHGLKIVLNSDFIKSENDKIISDFYSLLLEFNTNKESWKQIYATRGTNLSGVINQTYRIFQNPDEGYDNTYKVIEDAIMESSTISHKDSIYEGDTLYLPILPIRPKYNNLKSISQLFTPFSDSLSFQIASTAYSQTKLPYSASLAASAGSVIVEINSQDQIERALEAISNLSLEDKLKLFDITKLTSENDSVFLSTIELYNNNQNDRIFMEKLNFSNFSNETMLKIASINSEFIGKYLILDEFFENDREVCSHGDEVYAVAEMILLQLNAEKFIPKIEKKPLNFFDNRKNALKNIEKYYTETKNPSRKDLILKIMNNISNHNCNKFCIPEEYFRIIYGLSLMEKPEVISMSFSIELSYPFVSFLYPKYSNVQLFAAVENTHGSMGLIGNFGENKFTKKEPMFTYGSDWKLNHYLLVGGLDETGNIKSLYSSEKNEIGVVGNGTWDFNLQCRPNKFGSSYATPQIAVFSWIMKSYFKSLQFPLTREETVLRILLSADVNSRYLGRYGSGGIPNLNKMLSGKNGFLVRNNSVFPIKGISQNDITYTDLRSKRYKRQFIKNDEEVCGININEDLITIFKKNNYKWEKVEIINNLNLTITLEDGELIEISSIDDLKARKISQIVTYEH